MTNLSPTSEKQLHRLFEIGILLKGANAALEILLGFVFLFVNVGDIIQTLIENQLIDDPNDFIALHAQPFAEKITPGAEYYAALYLLSHGVVKIFLVGGLLRDKRWAYPASLAVLALFITYQSIKFLQTYSVGLALLTIFDIGLVWLIWHEYRRRYPADTKSRTIV